MPKGLQRFYGAGDLHFIPCSCYQRKPWLGTERRRDLFLNILEEVRQEHRFVVLGYVVMPEHFHLLMSEPQTGNPSPVMQSLKQRFAQRVVRRRRRTRTDAQGVLWESGPVPLWQPRFYDFNLWSEHKRIEKLRYLHRNPVKRGLVREPEQWPWSSFRYYKSAEMGTLRVNDCAVLQMRMKQTAPSSPTPAPCKKRKERGTHTPTTLLIG